MDGVMDDKEMEKIDMDDQPHQAVEEDMANEDNLPDLDALVAVYSKQDEEKQRAPTSRMSVAGLTLEDVAAMRGNSHSLAPYHRGSRGNGRGRGNGRVSPTKNYHRRHNFSMENAFGGRSEQENSVSGAYGKRGRGQNGDKGNYLRMPHYDDLQDATPNQKQAIEFPFEILPYTKQKTTVTFGKLSDKIVDEDIEELCRVYGDVHNCHIIRDRNGTPTGYGVADFIDRVAAEKAVQEYHSRTLDSIPMLCVINEEKFSPYGRDRDREGKRDIQSRLGNKTGIGYTNFR
ncbi:uncharacterized protein LOC129582678 [Paramacrobiotus metropolitanus]|uniref:uncharacterized protein LOC129582678 n=1 Tax=Paramacrobiotus metropolitanus TaxID=2943436 RepID=UPI002445AEE7|nr:uncharacterized protein LOC129582678 [Paramacrobiotus metropolitanus]